MYHVSNTASHNTTRSSSLFLLPVTNFVFQENIAVSDRQSLCECHTYHLTLSLKVDIHNLAAAKLYAYIIYYMLYI